MLVFLSCVCVQVYATATSSSESTDMDVTAKNDIPCDSIAASDLTNDTMSIDSNGSGSKIVIIVAQQHQEKQVKMK